ncbi:MAG: biopolymer transporter ExbD [Pseudomonadota bacterium]
MARPSQRRHRAAEPDSELNLIPIMNLVLMLIPAILITAAFVEITVINVSAPQLGPDREARPAQPTPPELRLTVLISDGGFTLASSGATLGPEQGSPSPRQPTVPRTASGDYDWAALGQRLATIKDAFPEETRLIIAAEPDIPYEVVVATMDASRETRDHRELFPDVVLSAGVS